MLGKGISIATGRKFRPEKVIERQWLAVKWPDKAIGAESGHQCNVVAPSHSARFFRCGHLIEVGETMKVVAKRMLDGGHQRWGGGQEIDVSGVVRGNASGRTEQCKLKLPGSLPVSSQFTYKKSAGNIPGAVFSIPDTVSRYMRQRSVSARRALRCRERRHRLPEDSVEASCPCRLPEGCRW